MAICPNCTQQIDINEKQFGALFTCPHCQSIYYVGWDGKPEFSGKEQEFLPREEGAESHNNPQENIPLPSPHDNEFITNLDNTPIGEGSHQITSQSFEEAVNEVDQFANSNVNPSLFNYSVTISGIDFPSHIKQIEEVFSDSRFSLKLDRSKIKNGTYELQSLSPVKASLLVQRLRFFDFSLTWRQNIIYEQSHS